MRFTNIIFKITIFLLFESIILCTGCKKLVDTDGPITSISGKNVYTNNATAAAVLTGLYTLMSQSTITGGELTSIGLVTGLTSDELTIYSGQFDTRLVAYYQNKQTSQYMSNDYPWTNIYAKIFIVNSAIEGASMSSSLNEKVKQQILGEAKFMRAFYYFHLVNLYGDVPLVISSDYALNKELSRAPKSEIWDQIILDLKDAQTLLSADYLDATLFKSTNERLRPTKWAATAMLARAYLYTQKWKEAEIQASIVIDQSALYQLDSSLTDVFLKNNPEAIWQLQPIYAQLNTLDAQAYVITADFGPSSVYISNQLLNSFELGDQRKNNWIGSVNFQGVNYSFAYKYKSYALTDQVTEYHTILRLGEQFLIRAEARAMQNNIAGSREDLKLIRKRAGLPNTSATTQTTLLSAIIHERQVELFTEWGHRWFDLKRTNTINKVMNEVTPLKGGSWDTNWQWFPIPYSDIQTDPNIQQNIGY